MISSRGEAALAGLAGLDAAGGVIEQQNKAVISVQYLRGEAALLLLFDAAGKNLRGL